jgi:hypothetical protein
MPTPAEIHTLHRYYIWANKMRIDFENVLRLHNAREISEDRYDVESMLYMSYRYSALYVVIEGWRELNLEDAIITSLLDSPNVDLLRRYRNGTFHFQSNYFDERFIAFIRDGLNSVEWIRNMNREFGRYFLSWYGRQNNV